MSSARTMRRSPSTASWVLRSGDECISRCSDAPKPKRAPHIPNPPKSEETTMSSRRILVTGATGETGRYTTDLLLNEGFAIRAFVHKADERSEKLNARGAGIVV